MKIEMKVVGLVCLYAILTVTLSDGLPVSQYMVNPALTNQYTVNLANHQSTCSPDQFHCPNGPCIHLRYVCNGLIDCPNGDDEKSCSTSIVSSSPMTTNPIVPNGTGKSNSSAISCDPSMFYRCQQSERCIPWSQFCDGKIQCLYGDDEILDHCKRVPGYIQFQPKHQQQSQQKIEVTSPNYVDSYAHWSKNGSTVYSRNVSSLSLSSTVDYSSLGNYTDGNGTESKDQSSPIDVKKAIQSAYQFNNNFVRNKQDPDGFEFVNFGTIINGDRNVNGNGNDIGNGNGNGNENGNSNGNGNGNNNNKEPNSKDYRDYRANYEGKVS